MAAAFRLARVLRLRRQLREWAQDEVTHARGALAEARERVAAARAAQLRVREAEAAAVVKGMPAEELVRHRAYEDAARARERTLAAETQKLAAELLRRRETLVARRREERQLEKLEERFVERREAAEEAAAMTLLDDLALRRR
jgi:flagellar export protein FliJ